MRQGHNLTFEALLRCSRIGQFAPRLTRARDQLVEERRLGRRRRGWLRDRVLDAERLVAHRELQLIRESDRGSAFKVRRRSRLLDEARRELASYNRLLDDAEREAA
jgi:hypothetical protein